MENKDLQAQAEILENAPKKQSFFSRLKAKHEAKKAKKLKQIESETLSEEEQKKLEEKIEVASQEVKDSAGKKTKIKNILFFVLNIVLVAGILIWNIFSTDDFTALNLADVNFGYVFAALAFLITINLADVMSTHRMIYRKTLRSRWHLSYKSAATLRYYDAITPLSSGGQAFMATYLTARDVPGSTSLSIPIAKLVFQQIAWLTISGVCLIISFVNGISKTFVSASSVIGFVLAFGMVSIILFLSLSKKFGQKMVTWVLKLLAKMKIIKNYEKQYEKVMNLVEDYQNIIKEYSRSVGDVIYQIILHAIRIICLYCIPYFIYLCFPYVGGKVGTFGEFFVYTALIDLASSFIPLPGGTGMNEITFAALFTDYLGGYTFWALLLWRFCSYYFYLLQGIGVIVYDTIYGNRKYKWVKKKLWLQNESQEFRRMQIESFRSERNRRRKKQKKSGAIE